MGLIASSWQKGRVALNELADELPPDSSADGTSLEYANVSVNVLPGPGVIKGDFMERQDYNEVYIVPDGITLIQLYDICKVLLKMK